MLRAIFGALILIFFLAAWVAVFALGFYQWKVMAQWSRNMREKRKTETEPKNKKEAEESHEMD